MNERLVKIINLLKENHLIKNVTELAKQIGLTPSGLNNIVKGNRPVSENFLLTLKKHYPTINLDFIRNGDEPSFFDSIKRVTPDISTTIVSIDEQNGFGIKFQDEKYLKSLPRIFFPVNRVKLDTDIIFQAPCHHPEEIIHEDDLLYTIWSTKQKAGYNYIAVSKDEKLLFGTFSSGQSGYIFTSYNKSHKNNTYPSESIISYWEIIAILTERVRSEDSYAFGSPSFLFGELINSRKKIKELEALVKILSQRS